MTEVVEVTGDDDAESPAEGWPAVAAAYPELEAAGVVPTAPWRLSPELFEPGCVVVLLSRNDQTRATLLQRAAAAGAAAVWSIQPETDHPLTDLPVFPISASNPRRWFAELSVRGHGLLSRCPPLYAVTGTDGKTTTACMMQHVLGPGAGYVGTLGMMAGDVSRPNQLTTPASDVLHDFLAHLPDQCPGVALEASSIGLHQARLAGLTFRAAVLTNVGSDHLDYHGSQAAYERAKRSLFASLAPDGIAVLPGDDPVCEGVMAEIQERTPGVRIFTVGRWQGTALLQPKDTGAWHLSVGDASAEFHLAMPGEYNRRNATQALLAIAGDGWQSRITALQDLPVIRGRLEEVAPRVFVDYAHTPQALHAVLSAVRAAYPESRLIAVAGCGGDRDVAKRPAMGAALRLADIAVITTDNPRSESPVQIAADMVRDLDPELIAWNGEEKPIRVVHDRGQAIRLALQLAGSDAVVVVCGKGHETQQLLATGPIAWDDAEVIRAEVTQLAGSHDI